MDGDAAPTTAPSGQPPMSEPCKSKEQRDKRQERRERRKKDPERESPERESPDGDKKKRPEGRFSLRSHTIDISWEHGAFFDVGDTEEASGDALEADGEATVRGHAVAEGLLYDVESIRIHATTEHLLAVVGCSVRPSASALCSPLCPSRAPQARISPAPHGISAPDRAHPCQPQGYRGGWKARMWEGISIASTWDGKRGKGRSQALQ